MNMMRGGLSFIATELLLVPRDMKFGGGVNEGDYLGTGWCEPARWVVDPWAYCNEVQYNKGSECTVYYITTTHCYTTTLQCGYCMVWFIQSAP